MNAPTTNSDVHSSTKARVCSKSDLADEAKKLQEESIVYVSDEMFRPYILLKDIDGELYWRPYGGEPIEQVRKFHTWELEAQKKFKNERRSQEDMDYLRNILMSVSLVSDFLEFEDQMKWEMLGAVVTKIAHVWYVKDNNLPNDIDPEKHEEGLNAYFSLAMNYVTSFFTTMQDIHQAAEQRNAVNP